MTVLDRKVARVFVPLLEPARYKGAYGGRGSGKSHFFAEQMIEDCLAYKGLRCVCIREVQKDLRHSSKQLLEDKIKAMRVGNEFKVFREVIQTPGDGIIIFNGMTDHTAESVKSLEAFNRAFWEEAQSASQRSLDLLRPTIRAPDSELWFGWNPTRKTDAVDLMMRSSVWNGELWGKRIVVKANWRDNPWLSKELRSERELDLGLFPERCDHKWEGDYARAFEGAYYAKQLSEARAQGRIGKVAADPLLPVRAIFDIGGSGASADAMAIWIVQFVGREIRILDYIEGIGQVLAYYVNELRRRGWGKAICVLPHDGINANNITGKRYQDHLAEAEFDVVTISNQGRGAAAMRIEAARRVFPSCWFNEATTEAGRDALGYYHEKKDEKRDVGLGPEHDWSSHAADAFGLMAVVYEEPNPSRSAWTQPSTKWVV